jgi:Tol biopolymer transport system component
VKLRLALLLAIRALFAIGLTVWGQVDSVIGQFTNSSAESFAGSISGDGRFVVFESRGNLATENPDNADNNTEIFLWDYAQRRIFQITRTKSVTNNYFGPPIPSNIRVDIQNKRPQISKDGKWIAFASNAYSAEAC